MSDEIKIEPTLSKEERERMEFMWKKLQKFVQAHQIQFPHPLSQLEEFEYRLPIPEMERDENGTLYGYKILIKTKWGFISPRGYDVIEYGHNLRGRFTWANNTLHADDQPDLHNRNGIYGTKRWTDLEEWWSSYYSLYQRLQDDEMLIAKLALWGRVIETTKGFRAEYAQIVDTAQNADEAAQKWELK